MPDEPAAAARLHRLEEALLFTERRLDEMHEHVLALGKRIDVLSARLGAMERMLEARPDPGDSSEPDPA